MKKRTKAGFNEFVFDVMLNGRFICTLAFEYCRFSQSTMKS
jgi:hypothetical protein